jgi:HSP20 family molecular chaperone IbpA
MTPKTSLNPPTGVLPFEMFRTFLHLAPTARVPPYEMNETEKECVIKISLPVAVDATKVSAEFDSGVLMLTLPKT